MDHKKVFVLLLVSLVLNIILLVLTIVAIIFEGNLFNYIVIGLAIFKLGVDSYRHDKTGVIFSSIIIGLNVILAILSIIL